MNKYYSPFDIVNYDPERLKHFIDFHGGITRERADEYYE